MSNIKIKAGVTYGKLTSIKRVENRGIRVMWLFLCGYCNKEAEIHGCRVENGTTKSCGCINAKNAGKANTTHGLSKHPLYKVWNTMHARCYRPTCKSYRTYGAIGITICKRWHKFINFYNDMIDGYSKGLLLDRIKNNKGYSKKNCKWSNYAESGQNTSQVRLNLDLVWYIRSQDKTAKQLAKELNVGVSTINDVRQNLTWVI